MPTQFALDNLKNQRLKASILDDMNDPFELLGSELAGAELRKKLRRWKLHMNSIARVLCFSKGWTNPLLWSHYAEKHRGCCLGFDVPDNLLLTISYSAKRLVLELERRLEQEGSVGDDFTRKLLTTKFKDWEYEDEVRMFIRPEETYEEQGLHFYGFSGNLILREVILGPRATTTPEEVKAATRTISDVKVITSRLAFRTFKVVRNLIAP